MELKGLSPDLRVEINSPLATYTYTRTGGPADYLVFPKNIEEVQAVFEWCQVNHQPLTVIGNASNLIVRDGGIAGVVMILTDMTYIQVNQSQMRVAAGASLIKTSQLAYDHGLTGLEFACGIPGSVGGAIFMNAGAYGGEVAHVVKSVLILNAAGQLETVSGPACAFAYRHSAFQDNGAIILEVVFELALGNPEQIKAVMDDLTYQRQSKQPLEYPSCGSVFKRPEGHFAGKLIQDAGLQGHQIGGVQVSTKHAGFMVNVGGGTASDYLNLIQYVQDQVWAHAHVRLEPEVRIIGREK